MIPGGIDGNTLETDAVVFATIDNPRMAESMLAAGGGGEGGGGFGRGAKGGGALYVLASFSRVPGGQDPSCTPKMNSAASSLSLKPLGMCSTRASLTAVRLT